MEDFKQFNYKEQTIGIKASKLKQKEQSVGKKFKGLKLKEQSVRRESKELGKDLQRCVRVAGLRSQKEVVNLLVEVYYYTALSSLETKLPIF